ncbi:hypothetical protein M902_2613 [Bacteriovorax sp. BAL6_X]|uniref:hypothetical protein n=1 Tax=Bacteriovorax sp. BAL6_X TaxID=1201290 RepID=UPI00038659E5|nr:hypothetical protein [Bacteriovorax sp. BAL6_X]EPZ51045.1 hypothetical protein M902_2613 [Bacteriovorax sp. BAL6_X]
MRMASGQFVIIKKLLITLISWSMLLTPMAYAQEQTDTNTQTQQEQVQSEEDGRTQVQKESDPNYCYHDGTNQKCDGGNVYNCHLEQCVNANDNKNYNMEYQNCGVDKKCQEDLKADAKIFTNHKTSGPKGSSDIMSYLAAAAQIGQGCVLLYGGTCQTDGIGTLFSGAIILALALMTAMGDGYKKKFKGYKDALAKLDEKDEKSWNHQTQRVALETEIRLLKDMEKAAQDKMKHHKRIMMLITISTAIAAICAALTIFGCPGSNPCTYWVLGLGAVALALENQALSSAKKAYKSANNARKKTEVVHKKLIARYNNQYNPATSQKTSVASAMATPGSQGLGMTNNDATFDVDEVKSEKLKTIPKMDIKMGKLGTTGENFANAIGLSEVQGGYNKTKATGNSKYVNEALDKNAAKINKAANRVLKTLAKSDKTSGKAKKAINAILDPAGNSKYLADTLAGHVSPVQMALNYRRAGGRNAARDIAKNSQELKRGTGEGLAVEHDPSSKDYLKKLKSQLNGFEGLLEHDDGIMALTNFDPTVSEDAVDQLNDEEIIDDKGTIHKDSKLSLWKIISNRYNVIKLKKTLE